MLAILGLIQPIINLLKSAGIIKDPAQEAAIKEQLATAAAEAQKAQADEFAAFIKSTSPDPTTLIGAWTDALYTIVREAGVIGILVALFYKPMEETLIAALNGLSNAGFAGLLLLSILLWEYYGREALTMVTGIKTSNGNGGGVAASAPPQTTLPPAGPSRSTASSPVDTTDPLYRAGDR